jgi:hypothetical protein
VDADLDLDMPAVVSRDTRAGRDDAAGEHELRLPTSTNPVVVPASTGDNQVYAAAELVRRGLARTVVLVNAAVDQALPSDWDIRGTPIHLERLGDGRTVLTAGPLTRR